MLCLCVWCLFRRLQEDRDMLCAAAEVYRQRKGEVCCLGIV